MLSAGDITFFICIVKNRTEEICNKFIINTLNRISIENLNEKLLNSSDARCSENKRTVAFR